MLDCLPRFLQGSDLAKLWALDAPYPTHLALACPRTTRQLKTAQEPPMSSSRSFPARRNHMPSTPLAGQRHLVQPDAFQEGSSPGSARKATRRIIRRTPLWQRIKDLPENMLLNLQVDAMLLDFSALGWPVGLGLNGAHFLIKLSAFTASFASGRGPAKSLWPSLGSAKSLTHADERLQELQRAANAGGFSFVCSLSCLFSPSRPNQPNIYCFWCGC